MKIYLAGPIQGRSDADCNGWRASARDAFEASGITVKDPMVRDGRGKPMTKEVASEIVEGDKRDIDECDAVLVRYDRPSVGTSMEILYAWERKKTVIIVNASGAEPSYWHIYHSEAIFTDLGEAIDHLVLMNAKNKARDGWALCDDCPPVDYPTDKTRCRNCPRRACY